MTCFVLQSPNPCLIDHVSAILFIPHSFLMVQNWWNNKPSFLVNTRIEEFCFVASEYLQCGLFLCSLEVTKEFVQTKNKEVFFERDCNSLSILWLSRRTNATNFIFCFLCSLMQVIGPSFNLNCRLTQKTKVVASPKSFSTIHLSWVQ